VADPPPRPHPAAAPRLVLFDWDGTLLESRERMLSVWHACSEQQLGRRWPTTPAEEELVFTAAGGDLFPFVAGGADAGIRIAVVTNKSRSRYEDDAREVGLEELIDLAVCEEGSAAGKPDPAPVLHALTVLGVRPEASVMFGDTPVDVAAAAGAGVRPIGVAWGSIPAPELLAAGAAAVVDDVCSLTAMVMGRRIAGR
jgi:phosphoglycolate phosphatase-like HAD superfamily hydrolase